MEARNAWNRLSCFALSAAGLGMLSACASATPREKDFNARLQELTRASQAQAPAVAACKEGVKKHDAPKTPGEVRELLHAVQACPGTPDASKKARAMILAADVDQDRPSVDSMMALEGMPVMAIYDGYRELITAVDEAKGTAKLRREVLSSFSKQLHHEAQGPAILIEAAIEITTLKNLSDHGWFPARLKPEADQLDRDFQAAKHQVSKEWSALPGHEKPESASASEKLRFAAVIQREIQASTALLKRAAALLDSAGL